MKRVFVVLFFCISIVVSADICADPNLQAAIEIQLGKIDPNQNDMLGLTRLTANSKGIKYLAGLKYAKNLKYLNLNSNLIQDVNELSELKDPNCLFYLFLSNNSISNISPLADLTCLKFLSLSGNDINDISSLANLTNIESLELEDNLLDDMSSLEKLTALKSLSLINNQIHDIFALTKLTKLNSLYLDSNPLDTAAYCTYLSKILYNNRAQEIYISYDDNPNPLTADCFTSLSDFVIFASQWEAINCNNNNNWCEYADLNFDFSVTVEDLITFSSLWLREIVYFEDPNLKEAVEAELGVLNPNNNDMLDLLELTAPYSEIHSLDGLHYAMNLQSLDLYHNQIEDLSYLKDLTALKVLNLSNNHLVDVNSLSELDPNELYLSNNSIGDIAPLENMTHLTHLSLSGNESLSDISILSQMTNLKSLGANSNQISDISALSALTGLKILDLSDNLISDISALSYLHEPNSIFLTNNHIHDISALANLTISEKLYLNNNTLDTDAYCTYLPIIEDHNKDIDIRYDANPNPLTADCSTAFADFSIFASYWMENACNDSNSWCDFADLNYDGEVAIDDLISFARLWLGENL